MLNLKFRKTSPLYSFHAYLGALFLLFVSSCQVADKKIRTELLDHQKPLGLTWELSKKTKSKIRRGRSEECKKELEAYRNDPKPVRHLREQECLSYKYQNLIHQKSKLFTNEDSLLSLVTEDYSRALIIEYSFLHDWRFEGEVERQLKRNELASSLRNELESLYGEPLARGYYRQDSETGFIKQKVENAPCLYWEKHSIGIILCSQRVVLIDGTEMSLSFIDLDKAPMGTALRIEAGTLNKQDITLSDSTTTNAYRKRITRDSIFYTIEDWLSSDRFINCQSENLKSLEEQIEISTRLMSVIESDIEGLSGEALSEYALKVANEFTLDITKDERQRLILYLMNKAAQKGNAVAKNEIGAALLYCFQNVSQDVSLALNWIQEASEMGDMIAQLSLSKMHLAGLTNAEDPLLEAQLLINKCDSLGYEPCGEAKKELKFYLTTKFAKQKFPKSSILID